MFRNLVKLFKNKLKKFKIYNLKDMLKLNLHMDFSIKWNALCKDNWNYLLEVRMKLARAVGNSILMIIILGIIFNKGISTDRPIPN